MLKSTYDILKKRAASESLNSSQKHQKVNDTKPAEPISASPLPPSPSPSPSPSPLALNFCNGIFKSSAENQKDFVLLRLDPGFDEKITHIAIAIKSILRSGDDQFKEIKRGTKCKVSLLNKHIHSAEVICKGSKNSVAKCMDSFFDYFEAEELSSRENAKKMGTRPNNEVIFKPVINQVSIKEQLNILKENIKQKEKEISELRQSHFDLLQLEKQTVNPEIKVINPEEKQSFSSDTVKEDKDTRDAPLEPKDTKKNKNLHIKDILTKTAILTKEPDDEYPLISNRIKEEIIKLSKESERKDAFLFKALFINSFKKEKSTFNDDQFNQFVENAFNLVKSLRPNVQRDHCRQVLTSMLAQSETKKSEKKSETINGRPHRLTASESDAAAATAAAASDQSAATTSTKTNLNGLTDEEKLNILETKPLGAAKPNIDYIFIDDS
jgi:hypothetical protein